MDHDARVADTSRSAAMLAAGAAGAMNRKRAFKSVRPQGSTR